MTAEVEKITETPLEKTEEKSSFLGRIGILFGSRPKAAVIVPSPAAVQLQKDAKVTRSVLRFQLALGNVALDFHLDLPIARDEVGDSREWIIHLGRAFYENVPQFLRIKPGEAIHLGRADASQTRIFGFDQSVADRHVRVFNYKGDLTIQLLEYNQPTRISEIASPMTVWTTRRENLMRLPGVLGRPLIQFDDEEALEVIQGINEILAAEAYRELNDDGAPGGIIQFPDDMTVLILGDVHARVDNVLRVITEGGTLAALERGEVCLVFLGDLIHSEEKGKFEEMDSSVLILDLFFMLKRRFPQNVFYVHGNHESFSPEVGKNGVPQGLCLRRCLRKRRGKVYVRELEKLFDGLAYVVQGNDFAACHGAPVRSKVSRQTLVNIRRYPGLQSEILWNRLRQGNRISGYGRGSVKRFRRMFNLSKEATLVVGHTPMSIEDTAWRDVGGIIGHHIIYSAHTHRMAAVVMQHGKMTLLEFVPEPALAFLNDSQHG